MHRRCIFDLQKGLVECCCRQRQQYQLVLQVQKHMKLHITKELTEKDVVSRIMRKENYLIGMLNKVCSPPQHQPVPILTLFHWSSCIACNACSDATSVHAGTFAGFFGRLARKMLQGGGIKGRSCPL